MDGISIGDTPWTLNGVRKAIDILRNSYPDIQPRVHGNGFIQLDLTPRTRLHVWGDPRIPRQRVPTPIHDHVFGFKSVCLIGRIINVRYLMQPQEGRLTESMRLSPFLGCLFTPRQSGRGPAGVKQYGADAQDTILCQEDPSVYQAIVKDVGIIRAGRGYSMQDGEFHESIAPDPNAPSLTVMVKDGPTLAQGSVTAPRVFVPIGIEPDNSFDRYTAASTVLLWKIIDDTLHQRA